MSTNMTDDQIIAAAGEPVADVLWFDPELASFCDLRKPSKIIDGSMSFMDSAELGTKLYTAAAILSAVKPLRERIAELEMQLDYWTKDRIELQQLDDYKIAELESELEAKEIESHGK